MALKGWIKLHRKITQWEWYDDANTFRVFMHLLLTANHQDTKYRGQVIPKGATVTGLNKLSEELRLTVQQVRTSLDKLKATSEITSKSTNKFSIVTICNFDSYQEKETPEQQAEQQANQQTSNKQEKSETSDCIPNTYDSVLQFARTKSQQANQQAEQQTKKGTQVPDKYDTCDKPKNTGQQANQQAKQQTNNKQATTPGECKELKNSINTSLVRTASPDVKEISDLLKNRIIEWKPDHKYAKNPPALKSWDTEIDRAIRLDGRTTEQLRYVIDYLFTKNTEVASFWALNIQSGAKLRLHFDTLAGKIKSEIKKKKEKQHGTYSNGQQREGRADAYIRKVSELIGSD